MPFENPPTRLSHSAALILKALSLGFRFGLDIMEITGLPSGTVYPALRRLERDALATSQWEPEEAATQAGRPARRYYEVTPQGNSAALAATERYPCSPDFSRRNTHEPAVDDHPCFDRMLLGAVQHLVPVRDREEWLRSWHSELWHLHHGRCNRGRPTATLALGLTGDALWLRTEAVKCALTGTAILCLAALASLCLLAVLIALLLSGSYMDFVAEITGPWHRFLVEAVLVVLVGFATTSRRHVHQAAGTLPRLRRQIFFLVKSALVLLLAFLVSADLSQPLQADFPLAHDLSQTFLAAILSIAGLRWAFHDQESRCKHCLHALQSPARIGRPSHNLLEWNGTEQVCRHGHGRLNLPEMETSWCRSGQWLEPRLPACDLAPPGAA